MGSIFKSQNFYIFKNTNFWASQARLKASMGHARPCCAYLDKTLATTKVNSPTDLTRLEFKFNITVLQETIFVHNRKAMSSRAIASLYVQLEKQ